MPSITIDGKACEFEQGQTILQVANANGIEIPQYCYHDGLSIVASCRICLAEVWAPNPRNDNKLEPIPKLLPTCQTPAGDGQVVYSDSPKAIANQKAVMEYLLINHPLDCPVCDQAGECFLQDYSYEYGRGVSRFEETKVKQPKKNLGPNVLLYSDRCIMCSRCVRFTREVAGTSELIVQGRGNKSEIDIFPGKALDNELSANVIDLCPVGALLDKDFLFAQRVWFLKSTPSVDGLTASGDNLWVDHNEGKVYRVRPRENMDINKWWITDEVRYGWKHVHSADRIARPRRTTHGIKTDSDWNRALRDAVNGLSEAAQGEKQLGLLVSPMLTCEDAFALGKAAESISKPVVGVGPIPRHGEDKTFPAGDPDGFKLHAEKAPNARGVRRVLEAFPTIDTVHGYEQFVSALKAGKIGGVIVTGNYPSEWVTDELLGALEGVFVVAIDTVENELTKRADVVLAGATWLEKAGTFENAGGVLQAFERAVPEWESARSEGQIGLDLLAQAQNEAYPDDEEAYVEPIDVGPGQVPAARQVSSTRARRFVAADVRSQMAEAFGELAMFAELSVAKAEKAAGKADMALVSL